MREREEEYALGFPPLLVLGLSNPTEEELKVENPTVSEYPTIFK
jgi:hypothetical protein